MIGLSSFLYLAAVKRPVPTEAMVERRSQILGMCFGLRSLKFLLEEKKLQECGLLGKDESTGDWLIPKFVKSDNVPRLRGYRSPLDTSPILGSPVKAP